MGFGFFFHMQSATFVIHVAFKEQGPLFHTGETCLFELPLIKMVGAYQAFSLKRK